MTIPSRQDNLPQIAIEASACGIPIVAFDIGGLKDIVEHRTTGFLTKPFSINEFTMCIKLLIENEETQKRFSINSRNRCMKLFSNKLIAEKYLAINAVDVAPSTS